LAPRESSWSFDLVFIKAPFSGAQNSRFICYQSREIKSVGPWGSADTNSKISENRNKSEQQAAAAAAAAAYRRNWTD
jgi:hypothetical protein